MSPETERDLQTRLLRAEAEARRLKLTLLDHYAANAPISLTEAMAMIRATKEQLTHDDVQVVFAKMRFNYAEAMLAERETRLPA